MSTRHVSRSIIDRVPISQPSRYICRQCRQNLKPASSLVQQRRYASNSRQTEDEEQNVPIQESWAERTRKKLWKGKPPGPANIDDVYGGPGFFKTLKQDRQAAKQRKARGDTNEAASRTHQLEKEQEDIEGLKSSIKAKQQESAQLDDATVGPRPGRVRRNWQVQRENVGSHQTLDVEEGEAEDSRVRTWEGLEVIGHQGDWRVVPARKRDNYTPWLQTADKPNWTYDELVTLFQQAIGQRVLQHPAEGTFLDASLMLSDSQTFDILENFSKLTHYRVPDPLLTNFNSPHPEERTVKSFLLSFAEVTKKKPKSVAEQLLGDERLANQHNLVVLGRRETPIDKEKEIGRWKIIEAELRARGLPVTGKVQFQN